MDYCEYDLLDGSVAAPTPDTPGDWDGDTSFTQDGSDDRNSEVFWSDEASPDLGFEFGSAPLGAICVTIRIDNAATGGDIDVAAMIEDAFSFDDPYDPGDISSAPSGRVLLGVMRTFSSWDLGASTSLYSNSNPTGSTFRLDSVDVEVLDADGTAAGGTQDLDEITRGATGNILVVGLAVATASGGTTHTGSASVSGVLTVTATGSRTAKGAAAVSGALTVTAAGVRTAKGAGAVAGALTVTATGRKVARGSASVSGVLTVTAAGSKSGTGTGSAQVSGELTVTASGRKVARGSAQVSGVLTVSVRGFNASTAAQVIVGFGGLTNTVTYGAAYPQVVFGPARTV